MSISEQGFFSPNIANVISVNRRENAEWFALVERLRALSQKQLFEIDPPNDRNTITILLMFARAVTTFQASVLLIERGLPADARTLVRSFLETVMHIGAARIDPEFYQKLVAADQRHKALIADPLIAMAPERSGLDQQAIDALNDWKTRTSGNPVGKLSIEQLMREMDLVEIYDTYFRGLSGDAAHTTVTSLNRHADVNRQGLLIGTKWGPDIADTKSTLMDACSIMFYLVTWVNEVFGSGFATEQMEGCWAEYKRLSSLANEAA